MLAKIVTTLDVISGGRAMLGIGAGWFEPEHVGYGFDFPPIRERLDRLDEALSIIVPMFRGEKPTVERPLLPRARGAELAGADPARRPADPDRRQRREAHAAPRREVRGREQPHLRAGGDPAQARGARAPLPGPRPRPAHDRQELARLLHPGAHPRAGRGLRNDFLARRGMKWDSLPEPVRDIVNRALVLGDPDTVGERVQREILEPGSTASS